eukprot:TRINITY_DN1553_c0_g3_i2.p1 TRINITY_DN1553_c0_g3~~TRINITY_DN1553_c0_g3_i2.p1  ORF type:complete len:921 (+),score=369.68 TRINITY_DN1553_c0_g3_i2:157-2919(+)
MAPLKKKAAKAPRAEPEAVSTGAGKQRKEAASAATPAEETQGGSTAVPKRHHSDSVFIKGLPQEATDRELRTWFESQVGPTVTCFRIRDDKGIVKFKALADAQKCMQTLQGKNFQGSSLKLEPGKQKLTKGTAEKITKKPPAKKRKTEDGKATASQADAGASAASGLDLRSVQLRGLSAKLKKEDLSSWVEKMLPGGCGLDHVRKAKADEAKDSCAWVVAFRNEANASRALAVLQGADFKGTKVHASYRALELSRSTAKAGRLIVRNLAFSATKKHLQKAFEKLGKVADVHVPAKPGVENQHRGFAFVQYADASSAEKAIKELNGAKICGRGVAVDWAVEAELYSSLQKEEVRQQHIAEKQSQKAAKPAGKKRKVEESDDEDEEDDKDEDDEGEESEEDEEDKPANVKDEMSRMKKLLDGDDAEDEDQDDEDEEEEDEEEEEEEEEEADKKSSAKDPRKPGFDVDEGRSVFVRNVPFDATEEDLRGVFKKFGVVQTIKFVKDASGKNAHRGSCFVKFKDAEGCQAALATETEAERKLKELSSVVKKSDRRELPAVEGFGISLRGRRLVLKEALTPKQMENLEEEKKKEKKGKAASADERRQWMHLLNVGQILPGTSKWERLSKSEQQQREASTKERKFRINNSNFVLNPLRLSIRNLPRFVDVTKLREAVVEHLGNQLATGGAKKAGRKQANEGIAKVSLVRDDERRTEDGERRSKGFGFVAFTDHDMALKTLEMLNDNPEIFGGGKRPIVEFSIEDKRKLRMQQDLYKKNAHKLLGGNPPEDAKGTGKGKDGKGKGRGKGSVEAGKGKGKGGSDAAAKKKNRQYSRGARQREKKRAQKAAETEKAARKAERGDRPDRSAQAEQRKEAEKLSLKALHGRRPKTKELPDAPLGKPGKKKAAKKGQLADDFELQALKKFRGQ